MKPLPMQREKTFFPGDFSRTLMVKTFASDLHYDSFLGGKAPPSAGLVLGLISSIPVATKIAKAAKNYSLEVHNSSRGEALLQRMATSKVVLLFLDFDGCEAEAFSLLQALKKTGSSSPRVPIFGFVSQSKLNVKEEAQRAGCDRVYFKTEFLSDLENLLARSAL